MIFIDVFSPEKDLTFILALNSASSTMFVSYNS